nr:ribonuclease H-like domain-containing protein [Tanacetum cinerariifolium]
MAILDEHLARFHEIKDAKTLWATIKTRFGGNAESKKMQTNVLKQQFEIFSISNSEGLDKGYDRFQRLLSLLEIHGVVIYTEDANQKFLRSLPSAWSNISLIMRNKPCIDNLDKDDLYNNLKVYEADIKGSSGSSSNSQNVAFISAQSTSSTNELNVAYSVSTATGHSSQAQVGFDKTKVECFNCHRRGYFAKDCRSARNLGNRSRDAGNAGALVIKTHNKTHYEILNGKTPRLDFMRPFGCPVTILNTLDPLGNFEEENAEFHQIVDFLSTCSMNYALTVSPTIYASYIEQFWNTATSKIVNSVKQILAIVDGKAMVVSESSVRSDLFFNDEDEENDEFHQIVDFLSTCLMNYALTEIGSGDRPRRQETTLGGADAQTRFETASKKSRDPPLSEGRNDDKTKELNLTDGADTKVIVEDKGSGEKGGSTADQVSTARPEVSTASVHVNVSAATPSTPPTTSFKPHHRLNICRRHYIRLNLSRHV